MLIDDYPFLSATEFSSACAAIKDQFTTCTYENGGAVSVNCENVGIEHDRIEIGSLS